MSHEIELGGEEKKASVLFSDIRNFTALSEQYSPKELLEILNQYLTCMSEAIESHGGVIDKYIGDAIMALFGAPITSPNSANLCVRAALAMQKSLSTLNKHFSDRHWPQLAMGIGINTSVVIAGNMGSKNRLNYTVIGDGVNLASRVEGLCKYYGVNIIVTQSTASEAKDFLHRELDRVRVKGKSESVSIYEPIQINSLSDRVQFDKYHNALKLYRQQQWDDAFREFSRLDRKSPQPLFKLYLSRIALFKHQPPEQDWDGTYVFKTK